MYLALVSIENFRCFGEGKDDAFTLRLNPGLTALVGENDAGKTAIVDAIRMSLGTTDQEWTRIDDSDFNNKCSVREIRVALEFHNLTDDEKSAFLEYLTYPGGSECPILVLNWHVKDILGARGAQKRVEVRSGINAEGPNVTQEVRDLLRVTYLRPLRDASQALSAGRGSRLSQVLYNTEEVRTAGDPFNPASSQDPKTLNVVGIGDFANSLLANQPGIVATQEKIDANLERLALKDEQVSSGVRVAGSDASQDVRLRNLLEKLDLVLTGKNDQGKLGLGSNNLLFISCELLLLGRDNIGSKLLLIEEPEAHLHAQRQLRVMAYLQSQAQTHGIQVLVTTHSPNLASAIRLANLVIVRNGKAYSLAEGQTLLTGSDYSFLERFLDVTKANLFFAKAVLIVEGDAENILIPALATMLGRDFCEHGVSIVNVGGLGLGRYARIFQRKKLAEDGELGIRVGCVTDLDVLPDAAPIILGNVEEGKEWPPLDKRRWRSKKDIGDAKALESHRQAKASSVEGQGVKTFVSDEWTLEYNLALGPVSDTGVYNSGLAEEVYVSARLAERHEHICAGKLTIDTAVEDAKAEFKEICEAATATHGCSKEECIAICAYSRFETGKASKSIAAQYLAFLLTGQLSQELLTPEDLWKKLPKYLVAAIEHVTSFATGAPSTAAKAAAK